MITPRISSLALAALALAVLPGEALAYTGPGAGLSALGSILALLAAVLFALVGFVWYPLKRLCKSLKKAPTPQADAAAK